MTEKKNIFFTNLKSAHIEEYFKRIKNANTKQIIGGNYS